MHKEQKEYCESVKKLHPEHFAGKGVLDAGSLDINGNNRYLFNNCTYFGVDVVKGPNVNAACLIHELPIQFHTTPEFDTIISTNTFEHDKYWRKSIPALVDMLRPGGLLLIVCSHGHPEHGTAKTRPKRSPTSRIEGWENYYRNLNKEDISDILNLDEIFAEYDMGYSENGKDLQFWGIKK